MTVRMTGKAEKTDTGGTAEIEEMNEMSETIERMEAMEQIRRLEGKLISFINKYLIEIAVLFVLAAAGWIRLAARKYAGYYVPFYLYDMQGNCNSWLYRTVVSWALDRTEWIIPLCKMAAYCGDAAVAALVICQWGTGQGEEGRLKRLFLLAAFLLSPVVLLNSVVGMRMDSLCMALLLAGFLLVRREHYVWAAVVAAAAGFWSPQYWLAALAYVVWLAVRLGKESGQKYAGEQANRNGAGRGMRRAAGQQSVGEQANRNGAGRGMRRTAGQQNVGEQANGNGAGREMRRAAGQQNVGGQANRNDEGRGMRSTAGRKKLVLAAAIGVIVLGLAVSVVLERDTASASYFLGKIFVWNSVTGQLYAGILEWIKGMVWVFGYFLAVGSMLVAVGHRKWRIPAAAIQLGLTMYLGWLQTGHMAI